MAESNCELDILRGAIAGDQAGLAELLESYRGRLRRMVAVRMDPRLRGRADASDVIQEAYLDIARSLPQYVDDPRISFFLWVRHITGKKLQNLHRVHLGYQKRDARREIHLKGGGPEVSSVSLAAVLVDRGLSPSRQAVRKEQHERLAEALEEMNPMDLEILALRHIEQLETSDITELLGISENAVYLRYARAGRRLRRVLEELGGLDSTEQN